MIRWNLNLSGTATSNTNNDDKTTAIKELLLKRNNRMIGKM